MGAFQSGFQMGSSAYQRALDNKDREERRKAEAEERALRLEAVRLGLDETRGRLAQQRELADMRRAMADTASGMDRAGVNAALDAEFDAADAASTNLVKQENVQRALQRGAAVPDPVMAASGLGGIVPAAKPAPSPAAMADMPMTRRFNPVAARPAPAVTMPSIVAQSFGVASEPQALDAPMVPVTTTYGAQPAAPAQAGVVPVASSADAPAPVATRSMAVAPAGAAAAPATMASAGAQAAQAGLTVPALQGGSNAANEAAVIARMRRKVDPTDLATRVTMLDEQLRYALASGDMQGARALQQEMRTVAEDGILAAGMKEYKGDSTQIGEAVANLNRFSRSTTMSKPDKNGMVRLSTVDPVSGEGVFTKLSRAEQARLYAASRLMQANPQRAMEIIGGINKTLADALAAENTLNSSLASNANQVAATSDSITRGRNQDQRAAAAETRAQTTFDQSQTDRTQGRSATAELDAAAQTGNAEMIAAARQRFASAGGDLAAWDRAQAERARAARDQAEADRKASDPASDPVAKADAGMALFRSRNPNATPQELEAVRRGVLSPVPKADANAPSDVKLAMAALKAGVPGLKTEADALVWARTSVGKPRSDVRADIFGKMLTANFGNVDDALKATNKAMDALYGDAAGNQPAADKPQQPGAQGGKPASAAPAKPKNQDDAHAQARAAIARGAAADAVNARLRKLGYQPLPDDDKPVASNRRSSGSVIRSDEAK